MGTAPFEARGNQGSKLAEAQAWLRKALADGNARRAGDLQRQASIAGIKKRTLQLAAQEIAVIEPVYGERGIHAWLWCLKPTR